MDRIRNLIQKLKNKDDSPAWKRVRLQAASALLSLLLVLVLIFAMAAAWYTNVAKTSSMTFQTESWGFDEEKISFSEASISIAPGTSGIIPLTVDNSEGIEGVRIGVTISKTPVNDLELQKRIYFYADTAQTHVFKAEDGTETEERVERIYLGASEDDSYTYTVLPGQKLTMEEDYCSDVPLRWEWVYDMEGYYFRGTVDENAEDAVVVSEYLRPIVYDYEQAVFERDENSPAYGQLLSVDGVDTDKFLLQLSEADGYAGTIREEDAVSIGGKLYYPVETDNSGYGVWAYLCTLDEVEEGIAYDTALAAADEPVSVTVSVALTASNVSADVRTVTTEAGLRAALSDDRVDRAELDGDLELSSPLSFTEGTKVINLNGYSLQYNGTEETYDFLSVADGASLTVLNGELRGNAEADSPDSSMKRNAVEVIGSSVTLSGVTVAGFDGAVVVEDMTEGAGDSNIQIINCNIQTEQTSVLLQGNGTVSDTATRMVIENSVISSKYYIAVSGQGANKAGDERWGTELAIRSSELSGYYAGLYQPQQKSTTTISNSVITGNSGVVVKGGTVSISDSTIRGTGAVAVEDAGISAGGFKDTGDGVYVEAAYNWMATVTLKGENEISSDKSYAVELFGADKKGPGKVRIYDGNYSGEKGSANWNDFGSFEIFGGTYPGAVKETITRYDS